MYPTAEFEFISFTVLLYYFVFSVFYLFHTRKSLMEHLVVAVNLTVDMTSSETWALQPL